MARESRGRGDERTPGRWRVRSRRRQARPAGGDCSGYPVLGGFERAAGRYDLLVGFSPGYHGALLRSAARLRLPDGGRGLRLLDAGCGTGASTAALLRVAPHARIVAVDASAAMLRRARRKNWPATVEFVHACLDELDQAGVRGPFDGVLASYLLRNLPAPERGVRLLRGLLAPGAPLALHEFSVRGRPSARLVWTVVCWAVIIPLGRVVTGRSGLYRYLWRSVLEFDSVPELVGRMRRNGFHDVRVGAMPGWQRGIVHTVLGRRPPREQD
ncbi:MULTISPECIES: class I SAM-dependent methyltransferase [unclassified Actinopolyspora]|uniref:class I SAM-dependent methyltransferase n=1 Tax=unclassified Actinopolyspora TaxID=2639451 RepID=UPI001F60943A|nr:MULTISPECIES: class I SAM-dependent methyltransferase [unclassified Actinopolyspora]